MVTPRGSGWRVREMGEGGRKGQASSSVSAFWAWWLESEMFYCVTESNQEGRS